MSGPTLLRRDVHVPNESDGFVFTASAMRGRRLTPGEASWREAVTGCALLPLLVESEDPANVRVVVGGELSREEQAGWVGRVKGGLRVPDGRLALCGGAAYVMEAEPWTEEHARVLEIPPGDYHATLYCHASAPNGRWCLERAGADEPLGAWFRRSRPRESMPVWLHNLCVNDPNVDPGHRAEWKRAREKRGGQVIDFLLHLVPARTPLTPAPVEDHGFAEPAECRQPDPFPLGLPAVELLGWEDDEQGDVDVEPVREAAPPATPAAGADPRPIEGGPVDVPVAKLARLARLAWMCQPYTHPELTVAFPERPPSLDDVDEIDAVEMRAVGSDLQIGFVDDGQAAGAHTALVAVAKYLAGVGDVRALELRTARPKEGKRGRGRHVYRGPAADGVWRVSESFPPVTAALLKEALQLAEALENGRRLVARDEAEAARIEARLAQHAADYFEVNPLQRTGAELALKRRDPELFQHVVHRAFWMRYADVWPLLDYDLEDG